MTYDQWMKKVDELCEAEWGMDSLTITGDWLSRDAFEEGLTPQEALAVVYETANQFGELEAFGLQMPGGE